jgi:hypothetical protein
MAQMSSLGFLNTFEPAAAPMQNFPQITQLIRKISSSIEELNNSKPPKHLSSLFRPFNALGGFRR